MLRTYDENHCAAYLTKAAVHATKQLLLLGVHPWAFGIARDTGAGEGDWRDTLERGQNRQKGPYLCSESVIIPGTGQRCCLGWVTGNIEKLSLLLLLQNLRRVCVCLSFSAVIIFRLIR